MKVQVILVLLIFISRIFFGDMDAFGHTTYMPNIDYDSEDDEEELLEFVEEVPEKEITKNKKLESNSKDVPKKVEDLKVHNDTETEENKQEESAVEEVLPNDNDGVPIDEITVVGQRPLTTTSDQTIRNKDFMNLPKKTASDLLRFVPGLHITQHTGGAKAHQVFLRGFDAEHGQDIAAFIDGIPINEVSHVHGMGYLDLHFIIPDSIRKIWVMNGPYDPRFGNFATAGVINFIPYKTKKTNYSLSATMGSNMYAEGMGQYYRKWYDMDTYMAVEYDRTDGYTNPGFMWAGRAFLNHRIRLKTLGELRLMYAGYMARSEAADILPKEMIENGDVSMFDSLDDSNRVDVDRHLAGITFDWHKKNLKGRLQIYYNYKQTEIFSNYTFYFYNPEKGDQLEQSDNRHYAGLNSYIKWFNKKGEMDFSSEVGVNLRSDWIDQTQANTQERVRFNIMNSYDFNETGIGVYFDERMKLAKWVRLNVGVRFDVNLYDGSGIQDRYGEFNIYTNTTPLLDDDKVDFSDYSYAISPKVSLIFTPLSKWNIFLNFGQGFSTSYARQIAWYSDKTIPLVFAAEAGTRLRLWKNKLSIAATFWWTDKEAETVFDSEVGAAILRGKSRRFGGDFEFRISPVSWLYITTDVYYVYATFVDTGDRIPNMANIMMNNIVSISLPKGFKFTIRGRFLGPREHDLGYSSDAYYMIDMQMGYELKPLEFTLSVENLLNQKWYDSVYAYSSRPEQNGTEVTGLHVTPGNPTTVKFKISASF